MILGSLTSYYEALAAKGKITRPGWLPVKIGYAVILRPDGSVKGFHCLKAEVEKGKKKVFEPITLNVPEKVVKTVGIKSNFMWENAEYMLGYGDDKKTPARAAAARELHETLLSECSSPAAVAVKKFFETWNSAKLSDYNLTKEQTDDFSAGVNLIFCDEDFNYFHNDADIVKAWESYYSSKDEAPRGICLVTGRNDEIAVLHNKISGVDGAQSVGASLVAFNANAFESYGNNGSQGLNAPVGKYAMYAYTTALNYLLKSHNRSKVGDTTVVWWSAAASEDAEEAFMNAMFGGDEGKTLDKIMSSVTAGLPLAFDNVDMQSEFYVLGLSPNSARVSVRFFYRNTFGSMLDNVAKHYARLEIVKPDFARKYLTPYLIGLETVLPEARDKSASPLLAGALLSAIINDWQYPALLYEAVMTRIRAEHAVTPGKAAIIKAFLLKKPNNDKYREVLTMALNEESTNRAYVLGRLFSVLEQAQNAAGNSGLTQRYFTSACTTPGMVFPSMLTMAMHHIAKAENSKWLSIQTGQLIDKLDGEPLPARLNNDEQGLFILGYYHQNQKRYEPKKVDDKKNKINESEDAHNESNNQKQV